MSCKTRSQVINDWSLQEYTLWCYSDNVCKLLIKKIYKWKKQSIAVIGPNPIQSTKFPQNPDPIQSNPIQSNPWMDPIYVQFWISSAHSSLVYSLQQKQFACVTNFLSFFHSRRCIFRGGADFFRGRVIPPTGWLDKPLVIADWQSTENLIRPRQ